MRHCILAAILGLAAATTSNAGVVIGDFEVGTDDWIALGSSTAVRSTDWADTGSYSLLVTSNDWLTLNLADSATALAAMPVNDILQLRVHSLTGDLSGATGLHMIISASGNGNGGNLASISDDYGYASIGDGLSNHTATISWTYDPTRLQSVVDGGLNSWQITLATNGLKPATFAIDNVQIVPEPTMVAPLIVGLLGLMRRRRS